MESGVVTVLYFFEMKRVSLKSFHDFWDTLIVLSIRSPNRRSLFAIETS